MFYLKYSWRNKNLKSPNALSKSNILIVLYLYEYDRKNIIFFQLIANQKKGGLPHIRVLTQKNPFIFNKRNKTTLIDFTYLLNINTNLHCNVLKYQLRLYNFFIDYYFLTLFLFFRCTNFIKIYTFAIFISTFLQFMNRAFMT